MTDAPHIIVCLPTTEQTLGARIAEGLVARGLRISLVSDNSQLQRLSPFAAICIGITEQKQYVSLVNKAIAVATTAQRPILPLLIYKRRELPNALRDLQWSDFTRSFDFGWRELLLALDMEGLSHWPNDPSLFDPDVVLVRAQNGLTPPDWQVYRRHSRSYRIVTRETFTAAALVMIISFLAFVIDQFQRAYYESGVYLVFGVIFAISFFRAYRTKIWQVVKYGPLIVLTPHGFLINEPGRVVSYPFAKLQSIQILELESVDYKSLKKGVSARVADLFGSSLAVVEDDGTRKTVMIPATFNFQPGRSLSKITQVIAARIVVAFRHAQKSRTSDQPSEHRPLIFLSYARSNPQVVDDAERGIRENGLQPWVDRSRLLAGKRWKQEIRTAIQQCSALAVFISPDSMRSEAVQEEYTTALDLGKPVIGVMVKACRSIPAKLRPYIYADMRKDHYTGFLQILFALERTGVLPEEITMHREDAPIYVLARGMMKAPLPDEQVFYGGKLTRWDLLFLMLLGGILATGGILNQVLMPVLYAAGIFVLIPLGIHRLERAGNVPEMLIIYPTGIVRRLFGHESYTAFSELDNLVVRGSSWLTGTGVIGHIRGSENYQLLSLPAHLHGHRQIAQRMVEAFQRSAR